MSLNVFQVDHSDFLVPYTYERARLATIGAELTEGSCLTEDEVVEQAQDADVLWLSWKPHIGASILDALPRCRLVIRWGIGFDQIDLDAATERGVAVANAPTYGTVDVAEHTLAMLMALARRIPEFHEDMRRGGWTVATGIDRMAGKTVGLIGVGRIGAAFAALARGIGLKVIGMDLGRSDDQLRQVGIEPVDLDTLLARSDYLSLHVPLTPSTENLVDAALLAKVKPGAILVNTSRGRVVDQQALIDALDAGQLSGAGLDVFQVEPLPADSPIRTHPRVLLTPHYAGFSDQSFAALREEMCTTTIDFLTTGWSDNVVNPLVRDRLR
jgi:D-3-phosphoglycerate dehydrogenase / 2-oxoglutarate reductase